MMGRQAWKKADRNGGQWKDEDDVRFFIHTPVSTVSLASKKNRPKLLAIHPVAI